MKKQGCGAFTSDKGGTMKKRISVICAAGIIAAAAFTNHDYVRAESRTIQSRGNLMFGDGSQTAVCSSDIQYLQETLDRLFGEIPNEGEG